MNNSLIIIKIPVTYFWLFLIISCGYYSCIDNNRRLLFAVVTGWSSNSKNNNSNNNISNIKSKSKRNNNNDNDDEKFHEFYSRRSILTGAAAAGAAAILGTSTAGAAGLISTSPALPTAEWNSIIRSEKYRYVQKFPTLFAPIYGEAYKKTIKRPLAATDNNTIWSIEQNIELGPLQTPIRCVVIRLNDGSLWVHSPLAPTQEFFELVESCGVDDDDDKSRYDKKGGAVAHVVVPTYALEHKIFTKDALKRWPDAKLWVSPGQFSFPFDNNVVSSDEFIFGKSVDGVLTTSKEEESSSSSRSSATTKPSWIDEIDFLNLPGGTFQIGGRSITLYETAFFHKASKSLIVTDALARIPKDVPPLNDPQNLLLISKRSTSDPMPSDTTEGRIIGWKKTALLVSYFFPEHEEFDPDKVGVVTWTDGWDENFDALSGRLIVPPVVRTLIYAQNRTRVMNEFVNKVVRRWDNIEQIVPSHFDAPIAASRKEFLDAFAFLTDDSIDPFPDNDLRALKPIANIVLR